MVRQFRGQIENRSRTDREQIENRSEDTTDGPIDPNPDQKQTSSSQPTDECSSPDGSDIDNGEGYEPDEPEFGEDSFEIQACKCLAVRMRENNPNAKIPTSFQKWAKQVDLMLRRDHRTKEQILDLIGALRNLLNGKDTKYFGKT